MTKGAGEGSCNAELQTEEQSPETEMLLTALDRFQRMRARQHRLCVYECVCALCVSVCICTVRRPLLEACGVDAGDRVELGDAALGGGIKALRLSGHLEEHFLLLQLPGELVLQGLLPGP